MLSEIVIQNKPEQYRSFLCIILCRTCLILSEPCIPLHTYITYLSASLVGSHAPTRRCPAAFSNRSACGCTRPLPSTQSPSTHHGQLHMCLVSSKLVMGTNSCNIYNHSVNFVFLCSGLSANRSACGVAMTQPSAQSSSTHHGRRRMSLVWSKSVGGTNSYTITTIE
jgi:hypothetical protein